MSTPTTTTVSFSMTVPTTLLPVIEEAFCATYQYPGATLPDGTANPITPDAFTRQCVVRFIQDVTTAYQVAQASDAAAQSAQQQAQAAVAQIN